MQLYRVQIGLALPFTVGPASFNSEVVGVRLTHPTPTQPTTHPSLVQTVDSPERHPVPPPPLQLPRYLVLVMRGVSVNASVKIDERPKQEAILQ